ASGVQQPVRADGDSARTAGDCLHAPAALARRAPAVVVPSDGRPWRGSRGGLLRDRPHALHRPWEHGGQSAGHVGTGRALWQRGSGARSDRRDPPADRAGGGGAVHAPMVAIRRRIELEGGESVTVDIVTGVAETREASLLLVEKYRDRRL